jgi:hypothetical protein
MGVEVANVFETTGYMLFKRELPFLDRRLYGECKLSHVIVGLYGKIYWTCEFVIFL